MCDLGCGKGLLDRFQQLFVIDWDRSSDGKNHCKSTVNPSFYLLLSPDEKEPHKGQILIFLENQKAGH